MCTVIKHVTRRLRRHWPKTRLVWRGDSHYGRVEAMDWAEEHGADYFGLAGNAALDALAAETAVNLRFCPSLAFMTQKSFGLMMEIVGDKHKGPPNSRNLSRRKLSVHIGKLTPVP